MQGGVNSPARSFRSVGGDPPIVMARGEGAYMIDVEEIWNCVGWVWPFDYFAALGYPLGVAM